MKRKTVNVEKLSRAEIDTDDLQQKALLLLKALYERACDDFCFLLDKGTESEEGLNDAKFRRDSLGNLHYTLRSLPRRGQDWKYPIERKD